MGEGDNFGVLGVRLLQIPFRGSKTNGLYGPDTFRYRDHCRIV